MNTKLNRLRKVGIAEGVTYLLIFAVSMPLKYIWDIHWPNQVVGMMHGILFIWYVLLLYWVAEEKQWSFKIKALGLLAALLPFGTFIADKRLFLKNA